VTTIGRRAALSGAMARSIRVEYAGAVYHVTDRGNERQAIYRDNADRLRFLVTVEGAVTRFGVLIHAYWLSNRWSHGRQIVAQRFGSACVWAESATARLLIHPSFPIARPRSGRAETLSRGCWCIRRV
jgi:hypothetical protein